MSTSGRYHYQLLQIVYTSKLTSNTKQIVGSHNCLIYVAEFTSDINNCTIIVIIMFLFNYKIVERPLQYAVAPTLITSTRVLKESLQNDWINIMNFVSQTKITINSCRYAIYPTKLFRRVTPIPFLLQYKFPARYIRVYPETENNNITYRNISVLLL